MITSPFVLILPAFVLMGIKDVQTVEPLWSYSGEFGPSTWATNFPACGGSYQSPINIRGGYEDSGPKPTYNYYSDIPTTMTLENNGHLLKLSGTYPTGKTPNLRIETKKGKTRTYNLDSVHFHWGQVDSEGSDHTFKGRRYAMEMHAVHLRVIDGVTVVPNQIVALAYVFKISASDNPALTKMLTKIADVKNPHTSVTTTPFAWSELIPQFRSDFYLYKGSLTVPPCPENVNFFIRRRPEEVSTAQMAKFRTLLNSFNVVMSGNFRPIQPRNDRTVYYID